MMVHIGTSIKQKPSAPSPIPDGIPNIADKWKKSVGEFRIVRSIWQWSKAGQKPIRKTWDPEKESWAEDGTAGGLDTVFASRLPQPLRIGSLQEGSEEHDELLKLVTEPIAQILKGMQSEPESPLRLAIDSVAREALEPVKKYQEDINRIAGQVGDGFKGVFPQLDVSIKIGMDPPNIDASKEILKGSVIKIHEGDTETFLKQQGTGSRRALFWSLLKVRNHLAQERKVASEKEKSIKKLVADKDKEQKKPKPDAEKIKAIDFEIAEIESGSDAIALPGYILLIDEPENALHPMAIRAARNHIYQLAKDPNWQVMLFDCDGNFYSPVFTSRGAKQYRYYTNQAVIQGKPVPHGVINRIPAQDIETLVEHTLQRHLSELTPDQLSPEVVRVTVCPGKLNVTLTDSEIEVPFEPIQSGRSFVLPNNLPIRDPLDLPVPQLKALVKGTIWRDDYFAGMSLGDIAQREGTEERHVRRLISNSLTTI